MIALVAATDSVAAFLRALAAAQRPFKSLPYTHSSLLNAGIKAGSYTQLTVCWKACLIFFNWFIFLFV